MRQALLQELTKMMRADDSVVVLTADTGFHIFDDFQREFRSRYLNVGISESAMIGMAAGLALSGKTPFVYGITPFVTMRCFEQIRVDCCYTNLPVRIIGVGAGLTYGPAGPTHHAIEDIAVMSSLPNMTVICPGDPAETAAAIAASARLEGPCYFRLGKSGEKTIHAGGLASFEIGKGIVMRPPHRDATLIVTGNMLESARDACEVLDARGLAAGLVSMPTVKPLDHALVDDVAATSRLIVTVEEHSIHGGLSAMVATRMATTGARARLLPITLPDEYTRTAGSQDWFRKQYGLLPPQIADAVVIACGES